MSPDDVMVKVSSGPAHFTPFITNSLSGSTSRLDIIWNINPNDNLKAQIQAKRDIPGVTTIIEGSMPVPRD